MSILPYLLYRMSVSNIHLTSSTPIANKRNEGKALFLKELLIEPFDVEIEIPNKDDPENPIIEIRHYDYRACVDTLLCRYIFTGKYDTKKIIEAQESLSLESYKYKYQMNVSCTRQTASGIVGEGVRSFTLSDMNNSQLKDLWKSTNVVWHDIYTRNAVIHLLTNQHNFGYDKFINYFKDYGNEKK